MVDIILKFSNLEYNHIDDKSIFYVFSSSSWSLMILL